MRDHGGQAEELGRVVRVTEPGPQRLGEPDVVHHPVPAVSGQVGAVVVTVLGDEERVGSRRGHRLAGPCRHRVVEVASTLATGHVGDVHPPAVEVAQRTQPPADRPVRRVQEPVAQLGAVPVELGKRPHPEPAHVVVARGPEVEVAFGGVLARAGLDEPLVAVAGVVRRDVPDDAHPPAVGLGGQPAQRVVTAEHRVDPVEGRRVVPMVRPGGEERSQVEDVRTQALEVVEVVGDPVQVAAVVMFALVLAPDSCRPAPSSARGPPSRARGCAPVRRAPNARTWRTGPGRPGRRRCRGASPAAAGRGRPTGSRWCPGYHAGAARCR